MTNESATHGIEQKGLDTIYAQLPQQDVEDFYASYVQWVSQKHLRELQDELVSVQQQIEANAELMQQARPSAIALATLARLQANGVSDIDLLDRMLDRGETWLDATMQRLEYCEQLDDFLSDDYEQWCHHALEGAYDWIDSMRGQVEDQDASVEVPTPSNEDTLTEATEELMLSKLTSNAEEDQDFLLEITLKRPAITPTQPEELSPEQIERAEAARAERILSEDNQAEGYLDNEHAFTVPDTEYEPQGIQEYIVPETATGEEEISTAPAEQPNIQEFAPDETALPGDSMNVDSDEPQLKEFVAGETPVAEDMATSSEEPVMQEFVAASESPFSLEDMPTNPESVAIQEYSSPTEVTSIEEEASPSPDLEEAEELEKYGETSEQVDEAIAEPAAVTNAPEEPTVESHEQALQWEWKQLSEPVTPESQAEVQVDEPRRRPNFLWRLLSNIWGR
ncbi:MAG TPA: hypothetical protein VJ761_12265 [Ktedonobacteraceae bacterium]|nr:hypothetical protein [Ktedonobacteraceae bacterium]